MVDLEVRARPRLEALHCRPTNFLCGHSRPGRIPLLPPPCRTAPPHPAAEHPACRRHGVRKVDDYADTVVCQRSQRWEGGRSDDGLDDDLPYDPPRGGGIALRAAYTAAAAATAEVRLMAVKGESVGAEVLCTQFIRDVVAGVGVGQARHVAVWRV